MTRKLVGSGLWESIRMMLPEHKIATINESLANKLLKHGDHDEQELELFFQHLTESL